MIHTHIGWLAGFLDGEGHVSVHPSTRSGDKRWYQASIGIRNTHEPTVRFVESMLEQLEVHYGTLFEDRSTRNSNHKDSYWINITGMPNLIKFIRFVLPYSITKEPQLRLMLEWCESRCVAKGDRRGYSDRELEIARAFQTLNKRGA